MTQPAQTEAQTVAGTQDEVTDSVPAAIAQRMRELMPILNGAGDPSRTFAKSFLTAVPEAELRAVLASVTSQLGRASGIALVVRSEESRVELAISYERGTARGVLTISADGSAQVTGFVIDRVERADVAALRTLDDVAGAIAALPGATGFVVADIVSGSTPLAAVEPDRPLAVASTFKLVLLAELVRSIDAGERKWSDTVMLGTRELPAGGFSRLGAGSKVTLRTLAEEMIRVSDNSATDLLLFELGRARVERMQAAIGFTYPDANVPFLSTMELFKLKGIDSGALGQRYLDASVDQRRRMLAEEVARQPGSAIAERRPDSEPIMIDRIEWFATPMDLVRAMGWFARHAQTSAGAEALRILALNAGPAQAARGRFGYAGYKGGSEPGVVSMTVLVRDAVARWKVVTATWNDPTAVVDEVRFGALVARSLEILSH